MNKNFNQLPRDKSISKGKVTGKVHHNNINWDLILDNQSFITDAITTYMSNGFQFSCFYNKRIQR